MKILALLPAAGALAAMTQDSPVTLQHGQWAFTTRFDEIEMPGQPAEVVAEISRTLRQHQRSARCISPEEAADPSRSVANNGGGQGCTFSAQKFENGSIDVAGSCPAPTGATMETTLRGTYTATRIEARLEVSVGGDAPVRMRGTMSGRRTGKCHRTR